LFAQQFVQNKFVLDFGCGCGYGAGLMARNGAAKVIGVDISEEAIQYSRTHFRLQILSLW
jgi:2-polyprenyl-3-methyl-5-hydroxy-6-metoxy-1,4-benzoquinol methylase